MVAATADGGFADADERPNAESAAATTAAAATAFSWGTATTAASVCGSSAAAAPRQPGSIGVQCPELVGLQVGCQRNS